MNSKLSIHEIFAHREREGLLHKPPILDGSAIVPATTIGGGADGGEWRERDDASFRRRGGGCAS